ncbi:hypothetical protein DFP93_11726 [Aneurinibacillus soli]|uniref:Membrane transport protein n=1 Tax=Aneurinibacillus soli TaxID=1500254 RepID=A0A0U5AZL8_9BACL|nr:hypothetical protein DFP93_11726 [Aneurinibacillus soli]BAU29210.1 Membrane transport protein [Aneurinibacillus soli]
MEISTVVSSIAVMAAMIVIGALLTRTVPFTVERRQLLMAIIINVAMPCIIFHGIFQTKVDQAFLTLVLITFVCSIILNSLGVGLGFLAARAARMTPDKAREIALLSGLGNTGFIGIPLCAALFGPKGALLAAIFDAGLDFTIWTLGVMILQPHVRISLRSLRELVNIPMIAIFVGMIIAVLNLSPPPVVAHLTESLANLASPLAMMYIGMLIPALIKKKTPAIGHISMPLVLKLCIFPISCALLLKVVSFPVEVVQTIIVQTAMPSMTLASILFARYSADEEYGATMTVFSTLLSIPTIPLMTAFGFYLLQ